MGPVGGRTIVRRAKFQCVPVHNCACSNEDNPPYDAFAMARFETSAGFCRTSSMSDLQSLAPDELERRVQQLRDAMSRMSTGELCDLMRDIQAKIREGAKDHPEA